MWEIHLLIHDLPVTKLGPNFLSLEAIRPSQGVFSPG